MALAAFCCSALMKEFMVKAAGKKRREKKREKCSGSEIFPEFGSERQEGMTALVNTGMVMRMGLLME